MRFLCGRLGFLASLLAITLLFGCATTNGTDPRDPYEGWNRSIFAFNKAVDGAVVKPVTSAYKAVTPKPVRDGLRNFVHNLRQPLVLVNTILQGKIDEAGETLARLIINTTVGLGGLFDVARDFDLPRHQEDFGQTFAVWGIDTGPYLVLPFIGPSTVRDAVGFTAGVFGDPITRTLNGVGEGDWNIAYVSIDAFQSVVALRPVLDQLYQEKDPYGLARSAYFQARRFAICDGRCPLDENEEDLFDDLDDDEEAGGDLVPEQEGQK